MEESTVFGGLFVLPWIWVILQMVVFGNAAYVTYLVLFCLVWDFLKTGGSADGETKAAASGDLIDDGESFEPVEPTVNAPGFTADGDIWTPAVVTVFGEGWFPENEPGDNWTPVAVPEDRDTWTPAVTPLFGETWFPEDEPDDGANRTPLTIPGIGDTWTLAATPLFGEGWFPEDEPVSGDNWTPVVLPDIGHNWTPAVLPYSGPNWFSAYGVDLDPVTIPSGQLSDDKLKIGDFRRPKKTPPLPGQSLYSVPPGNSRAKKTGLKGRGLKLLHRVKKMIEKKRMDYKKRS